MVYWNNWCCPYLLNPIQNLIIWTVYEQTLVFNIHSTHIVVRPATAHQKGHQKSFLPRAHTNDNNDSQWTSGLTKAHQHKQEQQQWKLIKTGHNKYTDSSAPEIFGCLTGRCSGCQLLLLLLLETETPSLEVCAEFPLQWEEFGRYLCNVLCR